MSRPRSVSALERGRQHRAPCDVGGSPPRDHRQSPQRPPSHLSPAARSFWRGIARQRPLTPDRLRLLTMCAETLDTYDRARVEIRKHGMTVTTRTGYIRPHPAVQQQVDARRDFLRLCSMLDVTVTPPANSANAGDLAPFPDDSMSEA